MNLAAGQSLYLAAELIVYSNVAQACRLPLGIGHSGSVNPKGCQTVPALTSNRLRRDTPSGLAILFFE